jgi:hypothetical protein
MATATEFTVTLENRPGTLAELSEALGNAGINIDGLQGMPCEGRGVIQLVTNDPNGAAQALDGAGIQYTSRDVLLLNLVNEPGALARVTRAMADAGINVNAVYVTMGQGVVMGVDNLSAAQQVASELGVA